MRTFHLEDGPLPSGAPYGPEAQSAAALRDLHMSYPSYMFQHNFILFGTSLAVASTVLQWGLCCGLGVVIRIREGARRRRRGNREEVEVEGNGGGAKEYRRKDKKKKCIPHQKTKKKKEEEVGTGSSSSKQEGYVERNSSGNNRNEEVGALRWL